MITVRPAVSDDVRLLIPVWRSAVEATHHFLTPDDIDWYEPHVADYLRAATDLRVATCQADEHAPGASAPLGFIAFDNGAIQMLFVTATSQRAGVGTALLAAVRETARRAGCADLTVDVNESNAGGRSSTLRGVSESSGDHRSTTRAARSRSSIYGSRSLASRTKRRTRRSTLMWPRIDGHRTLELGTPGDWRDELNRLVLTGTRRLLVPA
ncbi:GNAT family N-acetyltransferase [Herbiconiux moechotypicola]|uniref:N-acetyltransferase domain-containing protein n=1 Tax=Herbiconiux moechotypicola TaxID=637393 RepID=A0ABN3E862_9MICO|nr:GNAT family N-acetyltransferase [Herbiconiux moechotypicola]MCS5732101.1 GNAT family N-acetyltransferase [Herbiconiux moechotypicola]